MNSQNTISVSANTKLLAFRRKIIALTATASLSLVSMSLSAGNSSGETDHGKPFPNENSREESGCYLINLKTGVIPERAIPFVQFVVPPEDTSHPDGYYETVLKVTLNAPAQHHHHSPEAVKFLVTYDATPAGLSVNIGDSSTNNGFSGDGATQSNDAELQIGGLPGDSVTPPDMLSIYGHDVPISLYTQLVQQVSNFVRPGQTVSLTVADELVRYQNKVFPLSGEIRSPWLFALNGQADTEGPVNYDIYAAFNRVIDNSSAPSRWGSGVSAVKVCLIDKLQENSNDHRDH